MDKIIIAIDGPSGTGKSTTAYYLSRKLGITHIDSGAYYRAVTMQSLIADVKPNDYRGLCKVAMETELRFENDNIFLGEAEISSQIRKLDITNKVSNVSRINALRKIINDKLRKYGLENSLVMEGKNIGVDVFPEANFKFFIISDMNTRVARRQQEFFDNEQKISRDKIERELKLRDEIEKRRNPGILKKANNAIIVDSTNMIVEEQVNHLYRIITNPELFLKKPEEAVKSEKPDQKDKKSELRYGKSDSNSKSGIN